MIVKWYCKYCDRVLPLGLWDQIPYHQLSKNKKKVLKCPTCKETYFYCVIEDGEVMTK